MVTLSACVVTTSVVGHSNKTEAHDCELMSTIMSNSHTVLIRKLRFQIFRDMPHHGVAYLDGVNLICGSDTRASSSSEQDRV